MGNNKEWIKDSDLLFLILGGRYGTIESNSGKSYTQLEYEFAIENNIPVFAIVLNEQFLANKKSQNIDLKVYEHEENNSNFDKYETFKRQVMSNLVSVVEDINEISTEVSLALQEFIRKDKKEYHFRGWIKGEKQTSFMELSIEYNVKNFLSYKRRQGLNEITLKTYRNILRIFYEYFNNESIKDINSTKIKEFLEYREDNFSVKSRMTMESIRGNLNVFFTWLTEEGIIHSNPVKQIKPYKFQKKGNDALNNIEIKEIRNSCKTLRERAIFETFISTGCRLSELIGLKLGDIDWSNKTITISSTSKNRVVFLTKEAEKHINNYISKRKGESNFLFVTQRRPYRDLVSATVKKEIDKIVERSIITRKVTPNTLRNTFAKVMLDKGYTANLVDSFLGYNSKTIRSESLFTITNGNIWEIIHSRPDI